MERGRTGGIGGAAIAIVLAIVLVVVGCAPTDTGVDVEAERREATAARADERFIAGAFAYQTYCALCHGKDATGYAADHAPSLVSATFLESASDELITRGIRDGRPNTAMAAYSKLRGGPLDEEEIASILAFLRDGGPTRVHLSPAAVLGDAARGEEIYDHTCKRCHGTRTDRGNAVHLANSQLLLAASDAFLRHAIVHGRPGTPMPAFHGVLSDRQIDDVVAMLRSWGGPAEPPRPIAPPEPPPLGEVVINPKGKKPEFTLRDGRYVPIADVKTAFEAKQRMVIIDARAVSDWLIMHVPGSITVPYYLMSRLDGLPKDGTWILAYCACPHHASGVIVDELRKRGFTATAVMDEGILEWKKRGYPLATDPAAASAAAGRVPPPFPQKP